ncbi:MAG: efflux RND transporter permease subunit, partial [Planctomycetota bacterium]
NLNISNDSSDHVKMIVNDLDNNILTGFILVILVIFIFLGLRNSVFVALAIPISMFITLTVLLALNITLNVVVLFALILSLGMLVDNAIVIVENIYRHRQEGFGKIEAAMKGTTEVAWPVITSTVTTVVAFAPLLFWSGIVGKFMRFLPLTVIISLLSSLFVALVINPTLCAAFMNIKRSRIYVDEEKPVNRFMCGYQKFLQAAVTHRKKTTISAFGLLILVVILYVNFGKGTTFFPNIEPQRGYIDIKLPEGSSLYTTDAIARKIENIVTELDMEDNHSDIAYMVANVGSKGSSGFGFAFGGASTPNVARISLEFVKLKKRKTKTSDFIALLRNKLSNIPGVELEVVEEKMGPPSGKPINVEVSGDDYDALAEFAAQAKEIVKNVHGVVDLKDDIERGRPELRVVVNRNNASILDLNPMTIGTTIKTAYRGMKVGVFRIGDDEYEVKVIANDKYRKGFHLLDKLYVSTNTGKQVPVSSVAEWKIVGSPGIIRRVNQKRVITISGNVQGRLAPAVRQNITKALESFTQSLPEGYGTRLTGEEAMQKEASAFLSKAFAIAVLLIGLVLVSQFNSILIPVIILSSVLLSSVGVLSGLLITGLPFDVITNGVGIISLAGVVVNNAIVLIDYIQKLRGRGHCVPNALVIAGMTRLRPVLLTAITTIFGLIPMAIGVSIDFKEGTLQVGTEMAQWWGPMSISIVYGLAFATLLTLVMVPTFFFIAYNIRLFIRTKILKQGFTEKGFSSYLSSTNVIDT